MQPFLLLFPELTRELCRRGARVIMGVRDTGLGQDVAVDVRGETNGEIVVEYCDTGSLKGVRDFCTKVSTEQSEYGIAKYMLKCMLM